MRLVIQANIIHAPSYGDLQIVENAYLCLEKGRIVGIFDTIPEAFEQAERNDFGNALLMPSFGDMHFHAPQYPMLGMGMDLPLIEWLNTYTFKTEARFSDVAYARDVYKRLTQELIAWGTTRVCAFSTIHRESTLLLMEEFESAGLSGFVGKVNMDRNGLAPLQESCEESVSETLLWLEQSKDFKRIRPIITPRFTPSCSDELMAALGKIAKEQDLYVQSHLSENLAEIAWVKDLHPDCVQYWESYDKYGLFGDHSLMAHCVHSDARERKAMRDRGVYVVHCPDSNTNLMSGAAPVKRMIAEGQKVLLGSDIAGGAILSMMGVVAEAIRVSKFRRILSEWQEDFLTVAEAYYLASSAAAEYFGEKPGLVAGQELHALVIDDTKELDTQRLSVRERFERAFYRAQKSDIVAVYGAGKRLR
ncbi:MAG: amidohydrolase family protein [Bradymonadales bacterium]|jgi:guanine deaminase